MNYYNEFDPHAAALLRELIKTGVIADGIVDTRSIEDVRPSDLAGFTQCHFFAGIGGWSYALRLAGWPDDKPVWTGSCPCQPFSQAGKGAGVGDERHLWPAWAHLIRQCKPQRIYGEQVASAIRHGWLDTVFDDLQNTGYACAAANIPAASVGAPHLRERVWFVGSLADSNMQQRQGRNGGGQGGFRKSSDSGELGSTLCNGRQEAGQLAGRSNSAPSSDREADRAIHAGWSSAEWVKCIDGKSRLIEPSICPLVDGLPRGVVPSSREGLEINANATAEGRPARIRGYGNAIVPQVAAAFILATL